MPLINKQPFKPNPIPENLGPDDEVFYLDITNEIFTSYDAFFDRFLFCNSLIWTCSRTGKSGLTYKEALDSEKQDVIKKKKGKRERSQDRIDGDNSEPIKKKKKKYPYDPKKYSMPVPEGFDPSLLTPTGKIDGRKLKSKKNKELADELLAKNQALQASSGGTPGKKGKHKKKDDDGRSKEEEVRKKEDDVKKKAQLQAELAKERELEVKRKKEAAALAKQLERQKKEEERKKAAAFLQNWEKKCEDLERDDLKRIPQPIPLNCDIPAKNFGDAVFVMEALYNLHELYNISSVFPDGINFDTLEEILFEKSEDGPLGVVTQFLLRCILDTQPLRDGYGLDDDPSKLDSSVPEVKQEVTKTNLSKNETLEDADNENEANGLGSEADEDEDNEMNEDKEVKMNDLIGSAIRAAQEVKKSLSKPLTEMELNSSTITEILRLHLLQSGSFPKGRTIYNGWYSSREDPGLWLCMQEPDLIKKLGEQSIYNLDMEERIKIIHTLIYQLFSFIRTRTYIESASEQLTELRKQYRKEAAEFARWDRENCVRRMQPPKRKSDQNSNQSSEKTNGHNMDQSDVKPEQTHISNPCSVDGDANENEFDSQNLIKSDKESNNNNLQLKSCLKSNGTSSADSQIADDEAPQTKKKITFKTSSNGAMEHNGLENCENNEQVHDEKLSNEDLETFEELERNYQQNLVDYEDYQRERAIRLDELNRSLLQIRTNLRSNQSVYGIHPIGRDRAYRRYWLFQSLPGLFVELDDECVGKCLPKPTPLESRYKKLFNKENPLMHPNETDLIRLKTCDVGCSTNDTSDRIQDKALNNHSEHQNIQRRGEDDDGQHRQQNHQDDENGKDDPNEDLSERVSGDHHDDQDDQHDQHDNHDHDPGTITDEMNYCTGDETTCAIHGQKRPSQPRWWFYNNQESIDALIECLNKRGFRESELLDVLSSESSIIKPHVVQCPASKLNKYILEQSGIRRSRRLRTKGTKRRGRNYDRD